MAHAVHRAGSSSFSTELRRVVDVWPELPKAIRMAILALVQASTPAD